METSKHSGAELRNKVYEMLAEADAKKATNIVEGLAVLEEIKNLMPELLAGEEKNSVRNASNTKLQQELLFIQKKANIYYELEDYEESRKYYMELKKKVPSMFKFYRAVGDTYRKQHNAEAALREYQEGLSLMEESDYCEPCDQAELYNSIGLIHLDTNNKAEAIKAYEQAIKLDSKNPLYYCNKGAALYDPDNKEPSFELFKKAQELSKSDKPVSGLTPQNYTFINKTLTNLFTTLEKAEKIVMKKKDNVMARRQNRFVARVVEDLTCLRDSEAQAREAEQMLSTREKVAKIQDDGDLNGYYDGFLGTLSDSFVTATEVSKGHVGINAENAPADVAAKVILFIPFYGDAVSKLISGAWDTYKESELTNAAKNVNKFVASPGDFDELCQDVVADVIIKRKEEIKLIKCEENVLPSWVARFKDLTEKANRTIYGERASDPIQKLGFKSASELVSNYLASEKIYEGQISNRIPKDEKRTRLIIYALLLVDRDIEHNRTGKDYQESPLPEPKKEEPVKIVEASVKKEESLPVSKKEEHAKVESSIKKEESLSEPKTEEHAKEVEAPIKFNQAQPQPQSKPQSQPATKTEPPKKKKKSGCLC